MKDHVILKNWCKYCLMFFLGVATSLLAIYALHQRGIAYSYQGDSGKYIGPALGLLHFNQFGVVVHGIFYPELERLPLYPLLIFFNYKIFGVNNELAVVLSQCIFMGGIVVAMALITNCIAPRFTWVSALLTALCPNLFFRTALILPDLLFTFFVAWGVCFLIVFLKKNSRVFFILSSLFFGLGFMTRPALLLYPIVTFPFMIYLLKSRMNISFLKSTMLAILSVLIILVVASPQLIREKQLTGQYMLTMQGGEQALFWVYPCLKTEWGGKRNKDALKNVTHIYQDALSHLSVAQQNNLSFMNHIKKRLALNLIGQIPKLQLITAVVGSSLKLLCYTSFLEIAEGFHHNIPHTNFSLGHIKDTISDLLANPWQEIILTSQLIVFLLRGIQIIGVVYGITHKRHRALTLYLLATVVSFLVVSVAIGNPRYRAPIEPELVIFTVVGLIAVLKYLYSLLRIHSKRYGLV